MPSSKRYQVIEVHIRCQKAIEKALKYSDDLYELFKDHHSNRHLGYMAICQGLTQMHEFITKMKDSI